MACHETEVGTNYIIDAIKSIDRMQKEIVLDRLSDCITCETSLITRAYNTVPIILFMANGEMFSPLILGVGPTNFYRVECIREDRFVTLRLLNYTEGVFECSDQTCVLDLGCVCGLECLEPTNCQACSEIAS